MPVISVLRRETNGEESAEDSVMEDIGPGEEVVEGGMAPDGESEPEPEPTQDEDSGAPEKTLEDEQLEQNSEIE